MNEGDLGLKISDWLNVRRTLVCRALDTGQVGPQEDPTSDHDKLKFVGHSANLKSEI